jgi:hypothetical protein
VREHAACERERERERESARSRQLRTRTVTTRSAEALATLHADAARTRAGVHLGREVVAALRASRDATTGAQEAALTLRRRDGTALTLQSPLAKWRPRLTLREPLPRGAGALRAWAQQARTPAQHVHSSARVFDAAPPPQLHRTAAWAARCS